MIRTTQLDGYARIAAAAVAAVSAAGLVLQYMVLSPDLFTTAARLWLLFGYFTILTNGMVVMVAGIAAVRGHAGAVGTGAVLLSILKVAVIYQLFLAKLWAPQGLGWWADFILHRVVPLAYAIWWLRFAPKGLRYGDVSAMLLWPVAYAIYALVRGGVSGWWPYPFLDAGRLGWPKVAGNILIMAAAFAILATVIVAIARRAGGQSRPS